MLSIVIPSLGYDHLAETLIKIEDSTVKPEEIIVCLPKNFNLSKKIKSIDGLKILYSEKKGQVIQRVKGIRSAKNNIIMQLDDDIQLHEKCIEELLNAYNSIKGNNVFGPELLYRRSGKSISHHVKKKNILIDILYTVFLGARFGKKRLGTMTKEGICFGLDPEYSSDDLVVCDWLPGGCILGKKENFLGHNYYPYEGKAYCEDILNSILRKKKNIEHYFVKKGKAFTLFDDSSIDIKRYNAEIKIRKYINKLNKGSFIKFLIWRCFFYFKVIKNFYLQNRRIQS